MKDEVGCLSPQEKEFLLVDNGRATRLELATLPTNLADPRGFEPLISSVTGKRVNRATLWVHLGGECSGQLSYARKIKFIVVQEFSFQLVFGFFLKNFLASKISTYTERLSELKCKIIFLISSA